LIYNEHNLQIARFWGVRDKAPDKKYLLHRYMV